MKKENTINISEEEIELQKNYIKKIKELVDIKNKRFLVNTFGCQMSESDGEKYRGMLAQMGYELADKPEEADVIVFNTCCVREHAEEKIFSHLGNLKALKEANKDLIIAFGGCMAQQPKVVEKIKKSYRYVDIVIGTHNVYRFPELLYKAINTSKMISEIWDIDGIIPEGLPVMRNDGLKAWVDIMYGCNNFCSYCIVPYVRGRERSRIPEDIINEIEVLASQGYKEVTLLGQNVNSYGLDNSPLSPLFAIEGNKIYSFPDLLKEVCKIESIERIRFMTSNPKDFSDELIKVMVDNPKICRHVHLPFQSGSTRILEKMNRKYTKEQYVGLAEKIKLAMPEVSFTTDIIVGFPGETEEDFQDTLDVVKKVKFDLVYTFLYSKREGTPAALMEEQIDEETKKNRFDRLLEEVYRIVEENNEKMIGSTEKVLVEGKSRNNDEFLTGRAGTNKIVNFSGDISLTGKLVNVEIVSQHLWYLKGKLV
ncbi:MAG: tRNA (N6-isopentenyl adenosine(37)-C2)-methylthiotransferase MiaB [Deltaproteobacteria bacterium]